MPNETQRGMLGLPADPPEDKQPQQGQPVNAAPDKGQPAEPAPAEQKAAPDPKGEGQPVETPAQPEKSRSEIQHEHFQKRYQEFMEFTGQNFPEVRSAWDQFKATGESPRQEQQQQQQSGEQLLDEAPDPLNDPKGYATYVAKLSSAEMQRMLMAQREQERIQDMSQRVQRENKEQEQRLMALISPSGDPNSPEYWPGVPNDVVDQAMRKVQTYQIDLNRPGGATAAVNAFGDAVQHIMSERRWKERTTQIVGDASQKAKDAMRMQQPTPVGSLSPAVRSEQEQHLDKMMNVGGTTFSKLYGT